jgi:hypothetical protein
VNTQDLGDIGQSAITTDLLRRGYKVAIPYGENWDYDLILDRGTGLERVQVKYTHSDKHKITVRCKSITTTKGRVNAIKKYTNSTVDWIAVYDEGTKLCYYIPSIELGENGKAEIVLRWLRTDQDRFYKGQRPAEDYLQI